jgi:glycosyltransferase 2 family protein
LLNDHALKYLPPLLGLVVLAAVVFGLHGALRHIGPADVLYALACTPKREIAHALILLAASLCIMAAYDIPGILFARRLVSFPRLRSRQVALASFCAYALSHVLGAPALSAAAIRFRLYAQWRVPAAGIGRIVALSGSMFSIGLATLLGTLLLFAPRALPLFGHAIDPALLRGGGIALAAMVAAYIVAAGHRSALTLRGRSLALPGSRLALAQVVFSCLDTATACAILYVILPTTPGLTYAHVLGIYLAAFAFGIFSGLPAGVGVFDSVLLLGLSAYLPPATALGAILLFRVMYFLAPACGAALCYAGHELWVNTRNRQQT